MKLKIVFANDKVDEFSDVVSIDCLPDFFVIYFINQSDNVSHVCFNREFIKRFYLY